MRWTLAAILYLGGAGGTWAHAGTCRVAGDHADLHVTVAAEATTFDLKLRDVAATVNIDSGEPAIGRVLITSPLRFEATTTPVEELRLRMKGVVDLSNGRVHLGKDNEPTWVAVVGADGARLSLEGLGVTTSPRPVVPCERLALARGERVQPRRLVTGREKDAVEIAQDGIPLYAFPVPSDPIRVTFAGAFRVQKKYQSWVLIETQWSDGTRIKGWTQESNTHVLGTKVAPNIVAPIAEPPCARAAAPGQLHVTLRKGAAIAAAADGPAWAHVTAAVVADALVPPDAPTGWLRLIAIPGVAATTPCADLEQVWIKASDADKTKATATP